MKNVTFWMNWLYLIGNHVHKFDLYSDYSLALKLEVQKSVRLLHLKKFLEN